MKTFNVPAFYRSPVITRVKQFLKLNDPRRKNLKPAVLDYGKVKYYIARHFGFCFGVENAIEIAFRALEENPGKRIYLLSQMIHNPEVNRDLIERGVQFLQDTHGKQLIPLDTLSPEDVVIIPAFGAPLQLLDELEKRGIRTEAYNTTCPFVERVWKKSEQIGRSGHTIIIHGKYNHEETRSTFSRSALHGEAVVVVRDLEEAERLADYVLERKSQKEFESEFEGKHTPGFDIHRHFVRVGVINQTTMLASETEKISDFFHQVMEQKFGREKVKEHFADTHDTLCYATNENQDATAALIDTDADLAIVIGGYNSSNTSHLVELCEKRFPTYFIASEKEIESARVIHHYDYSGKKMLRTEDFLPAKQNLKIVITSGASCPDSLMDAVINRLNSFIRPETSTEEALEHLSIYN